MKCLLFVFVFLAAAQYPRVSIAGPQFDSAIKDAAKKAAAVLKNRDETRVSAKFSGWGNLPGGAEVGFLEQLREALSESGIVLSKRANLLFEARIVQTQPRGSQAIETQLTGQMIDDRGNSVGDRINCFPKITAGVEHAEQSGISSHLIGLRGEDFLPRKQAERFKQALDGKTVYSGGGVEISSNEEGLYGLAVVVGGQYRPIGEPGGIVPEGLAYSRIRLGEEYGVEVINNSDHECAVELRVDGLSVFHFADQSVRKQNGKLPRFFIIPPRSRQLLSGWVMSQNRKSRFQITPLQESAVARAGVSTENVGMVTLTFHASWSEGAQPPSNEPTVTKTVGINKPTIYRTETRSRNLPDGSVENYTVKVPYTSTSTQTATGFGTEESTDIRGVTRKIGVPRAVVAFRYQRD